MNTNKPKPTREKPTRSIEERIKALALAGNSLLSAMAAGVPESATARREYNGKAALFYESVFRKQLEQMVLLQMAELVKFGLRDDETLFIRSNINALNLIDEWFRARVAEHSGDIEEIRRNETENQSSEEIGRLKDIIEGN